MKHQLIAQAGVRVEQQVNVNGVILSQPVTSLQCNPSRRGAVRWNDRWGRGCGLWAGARAVLAARYRL